MGDREVEGVLEVDGFGMWFFASTYASFRSVLSLKHSFSRRFRKTRKYSYDFVYRPSFFWIVLFVQINHCFSFSYDPHAWSCTNYEKMFKINVTSMAWIKIMDVATNIYAILFENYYPSALLQHVPFINLHRRPNVVLLRIFYLPVPTVALQNEVGHNAMSCPAMIGFWADLVPVICNHNFVKYSRYCL